MKGYRSSARLMTAAQPHSVPTETAAVASFETIFFSGILILPTPAVEIRTFTVS